MNILWSCRICFINKISDAVNFVISFTSPSTIKTDCLVFTSPETDNRIGILKTEDCCGKSHLCFNVLIRFRIELNRCPRVYSFRMLLHIKKLKSFRALSKNYDYKWVLLIQLTLRNEFQERIANMSFNFIYGHNKLFQIQTK